MANDSVDDSVTIDTLFGPVIQTKRPRKWTRKLPPALKMPDFAGLAVRCSTCNEPKPAAEFHSLPRDPRGRTAQCKVCYRRVSRARYRREPSYRAKAAEYGYRRAYGITTADVEAMIAKQGGACDVCKKQLARGKNTHVDHDHKTGKVRGVLCHWCNIILGHLEKQPETLAALDAYLKRYAS